MKQDQLFRIAAILAAAVIFCAGGAAAMSVIAETKAVSDAGYPACTAPCICISESEAADRWGAEGYEMCSKTICGQTADAMIQFYCIHQIGAVAVTVAASPVATPAVTTPAETTARPPAFTTPATTPLPAVVTSPAAIPTKSPSGAAAAAAALAGAVILAALCRKD